MAVKSMESSFVYQTFNQNNALSEGIMSVLQQGTHLTPANMEEAFLTINKNFKYPLKLKVLQAVQDKRILLVLSPPKTRIPTAMPFFLTKDHNGQVVAFVLVDQNGVYDPETKNVKIDPKKLYTIMESALIAISYHERNREITKRNVIITNGAAIYSGMFTRVLNKKYALNVDKSKMQKVLFLSAKFYLLNVLGSENNEMTQNYAINSVPNGNPFQLREIDSMFPESAYTNLSTFIAALSDPKLNLGIRDLHVRSYMEAFIQMYNASALLALEVFPYFMYTVMAAVNSSYLNAQYVLEDIVERHGAKMYADILDFVR